jgi:uncharacterized protein YndB with AHSA1/START domain
MQETKARLKVEPGRQEVVLTHTFSAPPERVFQAYTDPQQIPEWWGPRDLETTVEEMDPRPGGRWRVIQRDSEGQEHAFHGVHHEVVPNQRLVRTFEHEGTPGHVLLETVTFEELGGTTKLTTHSVFQTVQDRGAMVASGMERGALESMERLAKLLASG